MEASFDDVHDSELLLREGSLEERKRPLARNQETVEKNKDEEKTERRLNQLQ